MNETDSPTDDEMATQWYCGPWWLPEPLRRALSRKINHACKNHDMRYSFGGSRRRADDMFRTEVRQALAGEGFFWYTIFGNGFIIPAVYLGGWLSKWPRWLKSWGVKTQ